MTANDAFQRAKAYIKKSLIGAGALKGKSPRIGTATHDDAQKQTAIPVTWYNDDGSVYETSTIYIPDGKDGKSQIIEVAKSGLVTTVKVDGVVKATIKDGLNGGEGKSAYDLAVEAGFVGTESDWLDSLKGEDGNGIEGISRTSTQGLIDTYTGTLSDGRTFTFQVTNGANITKLSELQNDKGFVDSLVDNLVNYYKKDETLSKEEFNEAMRNVGAGMSVETCEGNVLPTENISPTTFYLIEVSRATITTDYVYDGGAWKLAETVDTTGFAELDVSALPVTGMVPNTIYHLGVERVVYAQYMHIKGRWANLGTTDTDLSNYYTRIQIDLKLEGYVLKSALAAILSEYAKIADLAEVAFSGDYNKLSNLPEIPSIDGLETQAHAEQTFATKEDLAGISQIDDATTSATKTWSSQKTSGEIAKAKIVDVADRAAYEQIRNNPNQYDAEKFYAFPEDDSLCIMHDDKEITGKTNTLQLGETITLPNIANATFVQEGSTYKSKNAYNITKQGILSCVVNSNAAATVYLVVYRNGVEVFNTCLGNNEQSWLGQLEAPVKPGDVIEFRKNSTATITISQTRLTEFLATTGEPVDTALNANSPNPIANSAVADKFDSFLTTNASKGGFCFAGNGVPFIQNSTDASNAYRLVVFSNGKAALEQWGKSDNALKKQSDITMAEFRDIEISALQNLAWNGNAGYWWSPSVAIPNPPAGKTCVAITSQAKNGGGVVIPMSFSNNEAYFYSPMQEKPSGLQRFRCLFI